MSLTPPGLGEALLLDGVVVIFVIRLASQSFVQDFHEADP